MKIETETLAPPADLPQFSFDPTEMIEAMERQAKGQWSEGVSPLLIEDDADDLYRVVTEAEQLESLKVPEGWSVCIVPLGINNDLCSVVKVEIRSEREAVACEVTESGGDIAALAGFDVWNGDDDTARTVAAVEGVTAKANALAEYLVASEAVAKKRALRAIANGAAKEWAAS